MLFLPVIRGREKGLAEKNNKLPLWYAITLTVLENLYGFINLFNNSELKKPTKKMILSEDSELLKFGFEWLKLILTGKSSLIVR